MGLMMRMCLTIKLAKAPTKAQSQFSVFLHWGWSFVTCKGGAAAILLRVIFKILLGFWDHFLIREHYMGGHFNKFQESSTKKY